MQKITTDNPMDILTEEEIGAIEAEIAHLPDRESAAIDALKIVQEHRGWVSDESIQVLARHLDMSAAELDGIATFYNLIFRRPVGDNVILFCDSVSCWIRGCAGLEKHLGERLGISRGETSADNRFTLLPVPCLGACDKAPVMMVGDELHENLTADSIDAIIDNTPTRGTGA